MAAWIACASGTAHAAPEGQGDAVWQLLQDKGLVPKGLVPNGLVPATLPGPSLLRQARDAASELVIVAMNFLGVPYRRGGSSAGEGFDCSGFTRHIFESALGLVLPHRAEQQARSDGLLNVRREDLEPGDLVFFNTMRQAFSHVGIYLGDGKFIHAPRTGTQVRVEDMRQAYWKQRYDGARRAGVEAPGGALALPDAAAAQN